MTKVFSNLLLLALSFGLLGCGPSKQSQQLPATDAALRAFLGTKALDAVVTLPPGEDYYAVGTQVYEDGKMTNQSLVFRGSVNKQPSRSITAHLIWGQIEGQPTIAFVCQGSYGRYHDPFWTNVMSGLTFLLPDEGQKTPDGSLILGFASSGVSRDGKNDLVGHSSFATAIAQRKYVGALILKTFKTEAEWQAAIH